MNVGVLLAAMNSETATHGLHLLAQQTAHSFGGRDGPHVKIVHRSRVLDACSSRIVFFLAGLDPTCL